MIFIDKREVGVIQMTMRDIDRFDTIAYAIDKRYLAYNKRRQRLAKKWKGSAI